MSTTQRYEDMNVCFNGILISW